MFFKKLQNYLSEKRRQFKIRKRVINFKKKMLKLQKQKSELKKWLIWFAIYLMC